MNEIARELGQFLAERIRSMPCDVRLLVGVSGVPASGKSTLARLIVDDVNAGQAQDVNGPQGKDGVGNGDVAVLIGLDGWHLTRSQLDAFPDPKLAHDRRGAHWTFDGEAYVAFVQALREPKHLDAIWAPSFSHELKDPTPMAVAVRPWHRLVVIEGLYTFLGIPPWRTAAEMLDERWWLEVSDPEAEARLVARHVKSGVANNIEEAIWRSRENDVPSERDAAFTLHSILKNAADGKFIKENMLQPTRVITSVEDPRLKSA